MLLDFYEKKWSLQLTLIVWTSAENVCPEDPELMYLHQLSKGYHILF